MGATEGVPSLYSDARLRLNGHFWGRDASCDYLKACFLDGSPGRNLLEAEEGVEMLQGGSTACEDTFCRTHTHTQQKKVLSACCLFLFLCSAYSTNLEQV